MSKKSLKQVQLYDDQLDFQENKLQGPFGDFADTDNPYHNNSEPKYDFFGIPVYSPFGIGAGPLPTTRHIESALIKGFDIVTFKSVRTDVFPLNPYPHVRPVKLSGNLDPGSTGVPVADEYDETYAVANSFGIPSVPPSEWQQELKDSLHLPKKGQVVLAAFQGTARGKGREDFVQDHVKGISMIRDLGTDIIEINLSCPNEGEAVLACFDLDITERIVRAVRDANPDLKFFIKLAYFEDKGHLKELVKRVGPYLDGFSAINTMPVPVLGADGQTVFPGREKAGVSGAPIKWAGLEMTKSLNEFRRELGLDYKIISLGGVCSANDFHEYLNAGADTVMSVAGAMWNPDLAAEIKSSLAL